MEGLSYHLLQVQTFKFQTIFFSFVGSRASHLDVCTFGWLQVRVVHFSWIHHSFKIHTIMLKWYSITISLFKSKITCTSTHRGSIQ
jgi:hypothetical protein